MSLQSRLASLITAIGADVKSFNTSIGTLSSLTTTAKSSLVAAINEVNAKPAGSGTDPWTMQILTAQWQNSTVNAADVFTGFTPVANTRYLVEATLLGYTAATATGIQTALAGPTTGITLGGVRINTPLTATAEQSTNVGLNGFSAPATSLVSPNVITISGVIQVGATPGAGNIRVQMRSEVAGSMATLAAGSTMRWRIV